jgi:hypothetical protein
MNACTFAAGPAVPLVLVVPAELAIAAELVAPAVPVTAAGAAAVTAD